MMMKKLAFATLVAMGMTAAAIAQQPASQQPTPRPAQPQTQSVPQPAIPPPGGDRTEQVTFDRADKNADGHVNREEANDIDGFDFSRADTNNDASLSRQEYQAAMATSTPREGPAARNDAGAAQSGQPAAPPRSAQAGADGQAGGAGSQSGQPAAPRQQSAQLTFETADKNKDGKITREEATGVPNLNFTSADVNADASLSRQEFQTAMAGAQPRG